MNSGSEKAIARYRCTRRHCFTTVAITLGGLAVGSADALGFMREEISRNAESIHQEPEFKASAKLIYEMLLNTEQFAGVVRLSAAMQSGMPPGNQPTQISREVGGAFTLFGGHIVGRHIELVPNQRIVQAWRVATWDPGIYSIARFELTEKGPGTRLLFDHTAFPPGQAQHLAIGWKTNYWEPLEKMLRTRS
jgi:activator of HSP90 ATPase